LSTGFIGGGRKNWDGSGGSNGALDHFMETGEKYPLVVKLGTITADIETADCYSYAKDEDGPVKIPNLSELLMKRGINVAAMQKTVKSTAELEVELNATYAFDAITESGSKLVPVSGPGLQGLQNLGNSCYINSVVQMLFSGSIQELASRYGATAGGDITSNSLSKLSPVDAPNDLLCQSVKLASALTSGAFASLLPADSDCEENGNGASTDPKYRLPPRMFKHVVGSSHVDFCTGQQQDAAQYLQYLLEKLDRAEAGANDRLMNKANESELGPRSSSLFAYKTMSRLICSTDHKVKYNENQPETILSLRIPMPETNNDSSHPPDEKRHKAENVEEKADEKVVPTVSLSTCLDAWSASHQIDGLRWAHLNNAVASASEENRFVNFPRYLIVQVQRYELGPDWIPRKLEVNIEMNEDINLNHLRSLGPQDGEDLVPDGNGDGEGASNEPQTQIDEGALGQLMDMGFSMNGCQRALLAVGGSNVEAAMNWIFEHNSDPDFNDPPEQPAATASAGSSVDEGVVDSLVTNLGCFTSDQVRFALKECGGQADRAADWLFSHMDDLDGAIASLQSKQSSSNSNSPSITSSIVEDGDGKYTLVGMVSHIGKNTSSGHYVCHLKKDGKWVIFNDEKVALSHTPPISHAYMYLFKRADTVDNPNPSF
jgi:ubiquitin carboxyl-terminal hydrolase 5/13